MPLRETSSLVRILLIDRELAALVGGDEKLGSSSIRLIDEDGQVAHGRQFAKTALQQGSLQENVYAGLPHESGEQLSLDVIAAAKD